MHREQLKQLLRSHQPYDLAEAGALDHFNAFLKAVPTCFERSHLAGHVTASAWLLNPAGDKVLLQHHAKLGIWIQFGGHCDGDPDVLKVAHVEAHEETGLPKDAIKPLSTLLFDVDVHHLPQHKGVPAHWHYDVRFVFEVDDKLPLAKNHESHEIKWLALDEVRHYTPPGNSVLRMVEKTRTLGNIRAVQAA